VRDKEENVLFVTALGGLVVEKFERFSELGLSYYVSYSYENWSHRCRSD